LRAFSGALYEWAPELVLITCLRGIELAPVNKIKYQEVEASHLSKNEIIIKEDN
jgi:hypothetical protein